MLLLEWNSICLGLLNLAHNLNLDAGIDNIVEHQLVSRCTLVEDSSTNSDLDVLLVLARLERSVILDEILQLVCNIELVRVWIGFLGLAKLLDGTRSNLEILLPRYQLCPSLYCARREKTRRREIYIWVQFLLVGFSIALLDCGWLGRCCSGLLESLLFLLAILLALLEFGLGDAFAGDLVQMEIGYGFGGRSGSFWCVRHNCGLLLLCCGEKSDETRWRG